MSYVPFRLNEIANYKIQDPRTKQIRNPNFEIRKKYPKINFKVKLRR